MGINEEKDALFDEASRLEKCGEWDESIALYEQARVKWAGRPEEAHAERQISRIRKRLKKRRQRERKGNAGPHEQTASPTAPPAELAAAPEAQKEPSPRKPLSPRTVLFVFVAVFVLLSIVTAWRDEQSLAAQLVPLASVLVLHSIAAAKYAKSRGRSWAWGLLPIVSFVIIWALTHLDSDAAEARWAGKAKALLPAGSSTDSWAKIAGGSGFVLILLFSWLCTFFRNLDNPPLPPPENSAGDDAAAEQPDAKRYLALGQACLDKKDYATAITDFTKAIELKSDFEEALSARGFAYRKLHRLDAAIADLDEAIRLNPKDPHAHFRLAVALAEKKQVRKAASEVIKALKVKPDDGLSHCTAWTFHDVKSALNAKAPGDKIEYSTLRNEVGGDYVNAPGGFDKAIELAQAHLHDPGRDKGFSSWKPTDVDRPVPIITPKHWPSPELLAATSNMPGGKVKDNDRGITLKTTLGDKIVFLNKDAPKASQPGARKHEMTHATIGSALSATDPPILDAEHADRHRTLQGTYEGKPWAPEVEIDAPFWNYATSHSELDPRIAHVKREYVKATGHHVDTKDEAEKAIQWFQKTHGPANAGPYEETEGDVIDAKEPSLRDAIKQRMLELVIGESKIKGQSVSPFEEKLAA